MALAGKNGKLCVGIPEENTTKVIGIKNWSLSLSADSTETTYLGDDWKSYILGLKSWSGSSDGDYAVLDSVDQAQMEQNQSVLQTAFMRGLPVTAQFYVDDKHYYSGQTLITALNISDPVDGVVSISMDFTGNGGITFDEDSEQTTAPEEDEEDEEEGE